ncbi:MAG: cation transporter [Nitrospirota bacterium]|jgi:copper chaperone
MAQATLKIEGMSCQHCVMRVKQALEGLDGVSSSKVEIGTAEVAFDEKKISRADLEMAVEKAGYKVSKS